MNSAPPLLGMAMNKGIAEILVSYPKSFIALFIGLTAICGWYVQDFQIDASAETLLVENNLLYIESQEMAEQFEPEEFVLVAYRPRENSIFAEETLNRIESLSEQLASIERVSAVTSLVNVPLLSTIDNPMTALSGGIEPADWTWAEQRYSEETLNNILSDHPIFTDLLVNRDLSATAIQVVFERNEELDSINSEILALQRKAVDGSLSEEESAELASLREQAEPLTQALNQTRSQEIEEIYRITESHADYADIYLGGAHVLVHHMIDIILHDLLLFGSLIALIICVMLILLFRDWRWVLIPLVCCAISVIITMGIFGFFNMKTTVISSNFVALQLILTLALTIHLIVQYRLLASTDDTSSHHDLLRMTIRKKMRPCFYAGLTTSVGFCSLLFSGIQPVISFGWMMVVAVTTSIVTSLILFPAILALFKHPIRSRQGHLAHSVVQFFRYLCNHFSGSIVVVCLLISSISVVGLLRLNVENSFLNYFRDSSQTREELVFIDQELGGSTPMDVIYHGATPSDDQEIVIPADTVQTLQRIQASLETSEAIGTVTSVVNFLELARQINGDRPLTEYELNSLYLMIDETLREQLLGSYLDVDDNLYRISTRVQDSTEGLNRQSMLAAVHQSMRDMDIPEEDISVVGLFVLYQDMMEQLFTSQIMTIGLVFLALGLILLFIFRSWRVALIALIPNIIATLSILGFMGLAGIPLDLMTITIAAIAMGIAVDDTIHFVHHYLENLKTQAGTALENTFEHVGYAIFYTSLIITLGFAVLGFSNFIPSVLFGILTSMVMVLAFLVGMTLLPVLLRRFVPDDTEPAPG